MADQRKRGGFLRGIGDRLAWGQKGDRSFTPAQLIGGIGSRALNFIVPGLGTAANIAGNAYYGSGPLGGIANRFRQPGGVQAQSPDFMGSVTPPAGLPSMYQPANLGLPSNFMPSPYGPYAGGYQFPNPQLPPMPGVNPTSGLPNTQTSYGVELPSYAQIARPVTMPSVFANASRGSGGPFQSTFMNDPWGETAAGFGIGIGTPGQAHQLALSPVQARDRSA